MYYPIVLTYNSLPTKTVKAVIVNLSSKLKSVHICCCVCVFVPSVFKDKSSYAETVMSSQQQQQFVMKKQKLCPNYL